ncbi:trans-Golgi network integral membrane protein 2 [Hemicordylus capensis]|uniref:trans-Golgi network integral membrane protein 2 n=1 Tax=Hemicordylus capensis TaxID=884348 RepID=UPI00230215F3|nr:trans-Golgi network integral membrane protein 2 [Hemicordylus capensis]
MAVRWLRVLFLELGVLVALVPVTMEGSGKAVNINSVVTEKQAKVSISTPSKPSGESPAEVSSSSPARNTLNPSVPKMVENKSPFDVSSSHIAPKDSDTSTSHSGDPSGVKEQKETRPDVPSSETTPKDSETSTSHSGDPSGVKEQKEPRPGVSSSETTPKDSETSTSHSGDPSGVKEQKPRPGVSSSETTPKDSETSTSHSGDPSGVKEQKPQPDASSSDVNLKEEAGSNPGDIVDGHESVVSQSGDSKTEETEVKQSDLDEDVEDQGKAGEPIDQAPKNESENSHFFAYLVTTAIVVAALYIAYHNKRKIIAFALEGKKSKLTRRPKSSDYQRLDQKI